MPGFWEAEGRVLQVFAQGHPLLGNGPLWKEVGGRGRRGAWCGQSRARVWQKRLACAFSPDKMERGWGVERELAREKAAAPHLMYF